MDSRSPRKNHRHRVAQAAKEEVPAQTVREIHEHEDGTLIGPAQQSPDLKEIAERKRPPSVGEILFHEAEAMRAQHIAQEEAAAAESEKHPISLDLPRRRCPARKILSSPCRTKGSGWLERGS